MVRQHPVTAAVAITLALTASLAPTASADPAPLARAEAAIAAAPALASSPAPCGDVCSGHGYGLVSTPAQVASSKPVSHASQASSPAPCGDVCSGHGYGSTTTGSPTRANPSAETGARLDHRGVEPSALQTATSTQPTSVRVTSGGGFNWGDAGIGAGACAVLLGIGLAGIRTATKGRKRHPAEQRTIATS